MLSEPCLRTSELIRAVILKDDWELECFHTAKVTLKSLKIIHLELPDRTHSISLQLYLYLVLYVRC